MNKKILLTITLFILGFNAFSAESDFIGAWYFYSNYIGNDGYLLIQDYNGVNFVSEVSGLSGPGKKKFSSKIGIGKYDKSSDSLIVYNNVDNKTQVYTYDKEHNQLKKIVIIYNGEDGQMTYNRVDSIKLEEMKNVYFNLDD